MKLDVGTATSVARLFTKIVPQAQSPKLEVPTIDLTSAEAKTITSKTPLTELEALPKATLQISPKALFDTIGKFPDFSTDFLGTPESVLSSNNAKYSLFLMHYSTTWLSVGYAHTSILVCDKNDNCAEYYYDSGVDEGVRKVSIMPMMNAAGWVRFGEHFNFGYVKRIFRLATDLTWNFVQTVMKTTLQTTIAAKHLTAPSFAETWSHWNGSGKKHYHPCSALIGKTSEIQISWAPDLEQTVIGSRIVDRRFFPECARRRYDVYLLRSKR